MPVDWNDPCARAQALATAYYELVSGAGVAAIKQSGGNSEMEARYTKADINVLRHEMWVAEDKCRASKGLAPLRRRVALTVGSRRTGL